MKTLKKTILNYLTDRDYTNGGEIERMALESGYKGSTASRICRSLANEGILDKKIKGVSVWYKINGDEIKRQKEIKFNLKIWKVK